MPLYVAGELSEAGKTALEAHLRDCPGCAADLEAQRQVHNVLTSEGKATPPPRAPADLVPNTIARLRAGERVGPPPVLAWACAAAVGIALCGALLLLVRRGPASHSPRQATAPPAIPAVETASPDPKPAAERETPPAPSPRPTRRRLVHRTRRARPRATESETPPAEPPQPPDFGEWEPTAMAYAFAPSSPRFTSTVTVVEAPDHVARGLVLAALPQRPVPAAANITMEATVVPSFDGSQRFVVAAPPEADLEEWPDAPPIEPSEEMIEDEPETESDQAVECSAPVLWAGPVLVEAACGPRPAA